MERGVENLFAIRRVLYHHGLEPGDHTGHRLFDGRPKPIVDGIDALLGTADNIILLERESI